MHNPYRNLTVLALWATLSLSQATELKPNGIKVYADGRPPAAFRLEAKDSGAVLKHNDGKCPNDCDKLGARDVWTWEYKGSYYMHYDASGDLGWLNSLAVSKDLVTWEKKGNILDLGKSGSDDSKSASYGLPFFDGKTWHMFYLGTPNVTAAPDLIPSFPYQTMKAKATAPEGPWTKQYDVTPFRPKANSYYSSTASPGHIIEYKGEYLMFFAAATEAPIKRTLGLARTKNLDGPWTLDPEPILPAEEQIENSYLHYEKAYDTWFIFTNHVGTEGGEHTDAVWVYWSRDLTTWDPANKAVVLDADNCGWAKGAIGLPSLIEQKDRLALFYDGAPGTSLSHMGRDIGMATLSLPLVPLFNYAHGTPTSPEAHVHASGSLTQWSGATIVDGERNGADWEKGGGWNDATSNVYPDWVEIEFDKPKSIQLINVFTLQDNYATATAPVTQATSATQYGIEDFSVQAWHGIDWVDVDGGAVVGNTKVWRQFSFLPLTTTKLRIKVDKGRASYSRIVEVEAWGVPIRGCIDPKSPLFNEEAEVEDGTCAPAHATMSAEKSPGTISRQRGGFTVQLPESQAYAVTIRNVQGRSLAVYSGIGSKTIAWSKPGAYWIDVRGANGLVLKKFLTP